MPGGFSGSPVNGAWTNYQLTGSGKCAGGVQLKNTRGHEGTPREKLGGIIGSPVNGAWTNCQLTVMLLAKGMWNTASRHRRRKNRQDKRTLEWARGDTVSWARTRGHRPVTEPGGGGEWITIGEEKEEGLARD